MSHRLCYEATWNRFEWNYKILRLHELPTSNFLLFLRLYCKKYFATATVHEKSMEKATIEEKRLTEENEQNDGLTMSNDSSWRKRGFFSLFGIATLIGWHTGKVLDIIIKSNKGTPQ